MPSLLPEGLPDRTGWSRFDFSQWADGQAWKFIRGEDYASSTETFRYNVRRWAKANGYVATSRPILGVDDTGRPLPASKAEPVGLAVRFTLGRDHLQAVRRDATPQSPAPRAV